MDPNVGPVMYRQPEFLAHYHKRSNVEATFSAIKRKFGASVRSKKFTAQGERGAVQNPVSQPFVPRSRDARTGDRSALWSPRGVSATDLTDQEQANVRAAMRFLAIRSGGWKILTVALGLSEHTVRHVKKAEKGVSPRMALRVARLAEVGMDDVIAGRYPALGTCPHCGRRP